MSSRDITLGVRNLILDIVETGMNLSPSDALKYVWNVIGYDEEKVNEVEIEVLNILEENEFKALDYDERILFIPHCLRNIETCKGSYTADGFVCKECDPTCQVCNLKVFSKKLGYRIHIVSGGSMVKSFLKKNSFKGAVGIACYDELMQGHNMVKKLGRGIKCQMVKLEKDGCVNTAVEMDKAKNVLLSTD